MFSIDKENESVIVTGGTGFLGRHVCAELKSRGYKKIRVITQKNSPSKQKWADSNGFDLKVYDLRYSINTQHLLEFGSAVHKNKAIINLAASVGGIGANQTRSAEFMLDTMLIGSNLVRSVLEYGKKYEICKLVQIGTVCAYPKYAPVPFKEEDIWNGYPEETNAAYGIAKKTVMELVRQHNIYYPNTFNGINIVPVNLYGPGDNFDLESSHVIPALIRKFVSAAENKEPEVKLWGTGKASREFLYVKDAAFAIVNAMEKYNGNEFINIGTGDEVTIAYLAELLKSMTKYNGRIVFDPSRPDGQPRRCLYVEKAKTAFDFTAKTNLAQGLRETINWYKNEWHME